MNPDLLGTDTMHFLNAAQMSERYAWRLDGRTAIATHCLYPSNQTVTVYVSGGKNEIMVSDGGGSVDVMTLHGCSIPDMDKFLNRFCRTKGLKVKNGEIYTPVLPVDAFHAAVVMVANASAAAADYGVKQKKTTSYSEDRNIRNKIRQMLEDRWEKQVETHRYLIGKSNRRYNFDHVVSLKSDTMLVVDFVTQNPAKINSKVVAHWDLGLSNDGQFLQNIVYDNEQEWESASLNLLQTVATLTPFSNFDSCLSRIQDKH